MVLALLQLIATVAALAAVYFAFLGVIETSASRRDAAAAHAADMTQRSVAFERELVLKRLGAVNDIVEQVIQLRNVVQRDIDPRNRPKDETDRKLMEKRVPTLQAQLRVSLAALNQIGGPSLPEVAEIAKHPFNYGSDSHVWIAANAVSAVQQIEGILQTERSLSLAPGSQQT